MSIDPQLQQIREALLAYDATETHSAFAALAVVEEELEKSEMKRDAINRLARRAVDADARVKALTDALELILVGPQKDWLRSVKIAEEALGRGRA